MVLVLKHPIKRGEKYREKQYFLVNKVSVMGYVGKLLFRLKNSTLNVPYSPFMKENLCPMKEFDISAVIEYLFL
jgi:hypothetical protein